MTQKIELMIKELNVDPVQYKPYSHTMRPVGVVIVQLDIDEKGVLDVSQEEGGVEVVVLNMDGYRAVLTQLADAVERTHKARQNKREAENSRY